jgi:eukaryotic-like serine/threonine-protein kinase
MRIAIHGREVEVPKLVGLTPVEAESALLDRGLRFEHESRFYSDAVPEGHVLSQLPAAGTIVRRGWRVRVAESLGTPRARVPNVMGQSSRAAEINLRRRGLEVGKLAIVHLPNLPADQVVAVSPPPETVGNSPKVSLLLTATNPSQILLMPNVVGRRLAAVEKLIAQSRLRVAKVNAPTGMPISDLRGEIIRRQFPTAGAKLTPETLITLDVAR